MKNKNQRQLLLAAAGAGLVVAGWLLHGLWDYAFAPKPAAPGAGGNRVSAAAGPARDAKYNLRALGRIEPAGKLLDLCGVPGDRLAQLLVKELQEVKAGQELAVFDSRPLREMEWQAAKSQREEAEQRLEAELKVADERIAAAQLAVQKADAGGLALQAEGIKAGVLEKSRAHAEKTFLLMTEVGDVRVIAPHERNAQELAFQKADAEWQAAKKLLEKGQHEWQLAKAAAAADLRAAEAARQQVQSAIPIASLMQKEKLAKAMLDRAAITAPCDGVVLKTLLRPGESAGPQPVIQMADLNEMIVVAEVYEGEVKKLAKGLAAVVHSPAFREPYDKQGMPGEVTHIGQVVGRAGARSLDPLAAADRRVVEVRVKLKPEAARAAAQFVQMQAEVYFAAGGEPAVP